MRIFTKSLLALALTIVCVGGAKAKTELALPDAWPGAIKDGSIYTCNGSYQGAATGVWGDWSGTEYQYVWVKYTGYTGNIQLKIEYDEWESHQAWGDAYVQQSVGFNEASGVLSIAIDKTSTFVHGSAETDGAHKGEIYAKHIRQVVLQDAGAASTINVEGLYVGTYAEMLADMGYDSSKNHVLKITNGTAGSAIYDKTATYALASPLTEGTKYTVTAKICAADVTRGTTMKFVLSGGSAQYGDEKAILANTFHVVSETFTAGNGNDGIEVDFGFANGTVYLDDVSCVAEGSSTNLVSNGDFEEPLSTAGWTIPNWTGQTMTHAEQELGEVRTLPAQKVQIGDAGWATMVAYNPLSVPADVEAYFAKYDSEKGNVKLTAVADMYQWGRAVIKGDEGDYYFPQIAAGDVTAAGANNGMEIAWDSSPVLGNGSIYALGKKNDIVGFYLVKTGVQIPNGKPYLQVTSGDAREFIGFADDSETTSIGDAVKSENERITSFFDLQGRRVAQPTRGLYIVNGKKVVIK